MCDFNATAKNDMLVSKKIQNVKKLYFTFEKENIKNKQTTIVT